MSNEKSECPYCNMEIEWKPEYREMLDWHLNGHTSSKNPMEAHFTFNGAVNGEKPQTTKISINNAVGLNVLTNYLATATGIVEIDADLLRDFIKKTKQESYQAGEKAMLEKLLKIAADTLDCDEKLSTKE